MNYLNRPSRLPRGITHGLIPGVLILFLVIGLGVVVGVPVGEQRLDEWGSWLGAFIAGIALVASAYAVMIQARQGESGAWNIALSRLGEIYDSALSNLWMCDILAEDVDLEGKVASPSRSFTNKEKIWFGSLFMAYEQVFVASRGLSGESQRVWRRYLKNQLNKPTIRAAFILDSVGPDGTAGAKDYHHEFWRFVRGKQTYWSRFQKIPRYYNSAIPASYFPIRRCSSKNCEPAPTQELVSQELSYNPFDSSDLDFWMECYKDLEIQRQMYAIPQNRDSALEYLSQGKMAYTVFLKDARVGGFTVSSVSGRIGTFGFFLSKEHRGRGFAKTLLGFVEKEASSQGFLTLRADVYADNMPSIRTLKGRDFRPFIWFEKNLSEAMSDSSAPTAVQKGGGLP